MALSLGLGLAFEGSGLPRCHATQAERGEREEWFALTDWASASRSSCEGWEVRWKSRSGMVSWEPVKRLRERFVVGLGVLKRRSSCHARGMITGQMLFASGACPAADTTREAGGRGGPSGGGAVGGRGPGPDIGTLSDVDACQ
jgi:hypothetical protein